MEIEMIKRIRLWWIKKVTSKAKSIFYIGGSDALPPPLSRGEEEQALEAYAKGDIEKLMNLRKKTVIYMRYTEHRQSHFADCR